MRTAPLLAALLLCAIPRAAAEGSGLELMGPDRIDDASATSVPLRLVLTLDNVVCTRDAEVPVSLSIPRAEGARASLSYERVAFRLAPQSAARSWHGEARVALALLPSAPGGVVEILASYALPSQCMALRGEASGEARHALRFGDAGEPSGAERTIVESPLAAPAAQDETAVPPALQAIMVLTAAAGVLVVGKRLWLTRA